MAERQDPPATQWLQARPPAGEPAGRPDPARMGPQAERMLLLRAPSRAGWFAGVAEALAEVERVAGVRPPTPPADGAAPQDDQVAQLGPGSDRRRLTETRPRLLAGTGWRLLTRTTSGRISGTGPRLLMGPELPGLRPVTPAGAVAHLGLAEARGLPAPMRRRQPTLAWTRRASWRSSAGSVLTCDGPSGTSAQAVIGLWGLGDAEAVAPPPGGALVLRAWRGRGAWGLACGLLLGASETLGLGREAGRVAAAARAGGWGAVVLSGTNAVHLARAGDPAQPAPAAAARAASDPQVAAMVEACCSAGGLSRPSAGFPWTLAVTP